MSVHRVKVGARGFEKVIMICVDEDEERFGFTERLRSDDLDPDWCVQPWTARARETIRDVYGDIPEVKAAHFIMATVVETGTLYMK